MCCLNHDRASGLGGYFQGVSNIVQHALSDLFEDSDWLRDYVSENSRRLGAAYDAISSDQAALTKMPEFFTTCSGAPSCCSVAEHRGRSSWSGCLKCCPDADKACLLCGCPRSYERAEDFTLHAWRCRCPFPHAGALREADIPFVPAEATMMLWMDLRKYLTEQTWEGRARPVAPPRR